MFKKIVIAAILISFYENAFGQNTFGLHLGNVTHEKMGSAVCDSVALSARETTSRIFVGLFYNRKLTNRFTWRSEINIKGNSIGALVYNQHEVCALCPVVKAGNVRFTTIEIPSTINVMFPLDKKNVKLGLIAGISPVINFKRRQEHYQFGDDHPGLADVLNSLSGSVKAINLNYVYGLRADVWRFTVVARYARQPWGSATADLSTWGNRYSFRTSVQSFYITLGYNFRKAPGETKKNTKAEENPGTGR